MDLVKRCLAKKDSFHDSLLCRLMGKQVLNKTNSTKVDASIMQQYAHV